MAYFYVDYAAGSDTTGGGSSSNPFKTIQKAVLNSFVGDTIIVQGSPSVPHEEPDSIVIESKSNITIRVEPFGKILVKPQDCTEGYSFVVRNSDHIKIIGFDLANSPSPNHSGAILVKNSNDCEVRNNTISNTWYCPQVLQANLFHGDNSTVIFADNSAPYVTNSYPTYNETSELSFIRLSGNGAYTLMDNSCERFHSNSGWAFGLKVESDVATVSCDNFTVKHFVPEHVDVKTRMIGIDVDSDASVPNIVLNNVILDDLGYGIRYRNIPINSSITTKRFLVTNMLYSGVLATDFSAIEFRNFTIANCANGVEADQGSVVECINTIIYRCDNAFVTNNSSKIKMRYGIHFENTNKVAQGTGGALDTYEFARKINPKFVNPDEANFALADYSPGIDSGLNFGGDSYAGFGTDIGFYERGPTITEDDLPSLIARSNRLSDFVPLTEIDVLGVIEKGLETSDGTIIAGREGSAIRDVAVKPLDLLLEPYFSELEDIRARLSFDRLDELTEADADLLAANIFVTRDAGGFSSGVIRVYFAEAQDATIYAEHEFSSAGGQLYYNRNTVTLSREEMLLNFDSNGYYMDLIVDSAEQDVSYNIAPGEITTTSMPLPAGVTTFVNPFYFSGGRNRETNEELKEKAKVSITVRDIVTTKGAKAVILDKYPTITAVNSIGFRDPEMERDVILGEHIGGKTDIYIKPRDLSEDTKDITPLTKNYLISDSEFSGFVPILKIDKIELLEPLSYLPTGQLLEEGVHYNLISTDPLYRYSIYEELYIEFSDYIVDTYMPTTPMRVYFSWVSEMKTIQQDVLSDQERVTCADIMVRTFDPVFVSFTLGYHADEEIENLDLVLRSFIRGLKNTTQLQESDLVSLCYAMGAHKVVQPVELAADYHTKAGNVITETSPDAIVITRTSAFWDGDISVTYLGASV